MKGKLMMLCVFLVACVLMLSACTREPKTLIDADSLQVTCTGAKISVYDRLGGDVYNFITTRRKRSEGPKKAAVLVQSGTLQIVSIPGEGLEITSNGTVYRITRKKGVNLWQSK